MPTLSDFLVAMDAVRAIQAVPFDKDVAYDGHHVLVGRGERSMPGLCLNNKSYRVPDAADESASFTSVADLATRGPADLLDGFAPWADRPLTPNEALDRVVLVVEDVSPDSVFGVFVTLARVYGVDVAEIPPAWGRAVHLWETTGNCQNPDTSWCALESALYHSRFPVAGSPDAAIYSAAWAEALRFLTACLKRGLEPEAIAGLDDVPEYVAAKIALANDEQAYLDWLPHARIVQLSLPAAHGSDRRVIVDGFMVVEDAGLGAAKSFYRNDRKHSPLGKGFVFAAHYRPHASKDDHGNQFTITVDERAGVHIKDLWVELERRENAAWAKRPDGKQRPTDNPRQTIGIEHKIYNQPWYIDRPQTLIASPRQLGGEFEFGTLLGWEEVCDAIWSVYHPLNDVQVTAKLRGPLWNLLDLGKTAETVGEKRLLVAHWPKDDQKSSDAAEKKKFAPLRGLSSAPSVHRSIAALVDRGGPGPQSLADLPTAKTWREVTLSGGFAIITNKGLFVLDDWREQQLIVDHVADTFRQAAGLNEKLTEMNATSDIKDRPAVGRLRRLVHNVTEALNGNVQDLDVLRRDAGRIRAELASIRGKLATPPKDADARLVRAALDEHWGLDMRLTAAEKEVEALEASLKTLVEMRTARVTRAIGLIGFPLYIATGLAGPFARLFIAKPSETDPDAELVVVLIVVLSAVIAGAMWLMVRKDDPMRRR